MGIKLGKQNTKDLRKAAQEESKQVMLLARECLADPKFKRYKEKALAHKDKLLKQIFKHRNSNLAEYAFEMRELLAVADFSLMLLEDVEREAKMEVKLETKEEKDDA